MTGHHGVVQLTASTAVECAGGLVRRYEAGTQFRRLGPDVLGRFKAADGQGRVVLLGTDQVEPVDADDDDDGTTDLDDDSSDAAPVGRGWDLSAPRRPNRRPDLPKAPTLAELVRAGVVSPAVTLAR